MCLVLSVADIHVNYAKHNVLTGIDFEVEQGEILCLLGPSGCGKTTILKAVAGLLPITQGYIDIKQNRVSHGEVMLPPEQRNLGMLFQDYALFPHLNVADNITYGLRKATKQAKQQRLDDLLAMIHLSGCKHKYPHELSGGQQQRVALARALAYQPDILLLDEPFSNIDNKVKFELIEQVREIIKKANVAAIFVSHSKEEAFAFADKVAVINRGKIEQIGHPQALYSQPSNLFVAQFMGKLNSFKLEQLPSALKKILTTPFVSDAEYVAFRPEHIQVVEHLTEQTVTATVEQRRFSGSQSILQVKLKDSDSIIYILAPFNAAPEIADEIQLHFLTDKALWF